MSFIDISKLSRDELKTGDIVKYKPEGAVKPSDFWFKLNGGSCILYEHEADIGVEGMAVWKPQKTSVDPWRRRADMKNGEAVRQAVQEQAVLAERAQPATAMNMDYCLARLLEISVREDELARERKEVQRQLVLLVNAEKRPEVSAPSPAASASATVSNSSTGTKKNKK